MKFANKIISALVFSALALTLTENSFSQTRTVRASASTTSRTVLFDLDELRPGMKGVARTVFSGSEPQEFNLEILGLLAGFSGPRQSTIIARLSGANVARTGVFAGMSGSPVFIDGRLVGAIAFSFPFAKEPICGITPIQQMIDIFARQTGTSEHAHEPHTVSFAKLAATDLQLNWPKLAFSSGPLLAPVSAGSPLMPLMGQQIAPIATPFVFSGISNEALAQF